MKLKDWMLSVRGKIPTLSDKFSFLSQEEDENVNEGQDADSEEEDLERGLMQRIIGHRSAKQRMYLAAVILAAAAVIGFLVYDRLVTYDGYTIAASYENTAATGTAYVAAGKNILKYNADGITCVSKNNDLKWSVTYSMQSTISDVCGTTMAVAEQHGTQIYVAGKDGELGHFETDNPILKVRVSGQGVVAAVLQDDNVTWVNLYRPDGTLIVSDKTTMMESGYPVDVAVSPDGEMMAVSYVQITGGVLSDTVTFYNFGTAGQKKENHVVGSETFEGAVIPEIYFVDNSRAVAVTDSGYVVFSGSSTPEKTASTEFEEEILSCFHEGDTIGFVFDSEDTENRYRICLYNLKGKKKKEFMTDFSYSDIKMENGQILMYSDNDLAVYTSSGHLRFQSSYQNKVVGFHYFSEYRKYLVITSESFDRIRIESGGGE